MVLSNLGRQLDRRDFQVFDPCWRAPIWNVFRLTDRCPLGRIRRYTYTSCAATFNRCDINTTYNFFGVFKKQFYFSIVVLACDFYVHSCFLSCCWTTVFPQWGWIKHLSIVFDFLFLFWGGCSCDETGSCCKLGNDDGYNRDAARVTSFFSRWTKFPHLKKSNTRAFSLFLTDFGESLVEHRGAACSPILLPKRATGRKKIRLAKPFIKTNKSLFPDGRVN